MTTSLSTTRTRTPSFSTWRAWWKASRSPSWKSELRPQHALGRSPRHTPPWERGGPRPCNPQIHLTRLTTAVTRLCCGAGRGTKPHCSSVCLARPPVPAVELRPEPLGKGPCTCQTLIYCPPVSGAQGQAHQDSEGHCRLQRMSSRARKDDSTNPFISKHLRRPRPTCLTSLLLLSGWTK